MSNKGLIGAGVLLAAMVATSAVAKEKKQKPSQLLDAVIACAAIAEEPARLRCYDGEVARLSEARKGKRLTLKEATFEDEFEDIDSTIRSVAQAGHAQWVLVLADDTVWRTTEGMRGMPRSGDKIKIRKGMMSGFRASINEGSIVNVRRMQ